MAMADTATTASAAAASAASTSTDAPPFQLGKPRFQQVRAGLWSEGQRVAQRGRANSSFKSPFSPRVSDPRPPRSLQLLDRGPWPQLLLFHWSAEWTRMPTLAPYWPSALSLCGCSRPLAFPPPRHSVIGRCWPRSGMRGTWVPAASAGSLWAVQPTPGGKFKSGSG